MVVISIQLLFFETSFFRGQEHRFTCTKLDEILIQNKLKFLGFIISPKIKSLYINHFPDDKSQTSLNNWGILEKNYPGIFVGTPPFWVSKTNI